MTHGIISFRGFIYIRICDIPIDLYRSPCCLYVLKSIKKRFFDVCEQVAGGK